MPHPVMFDDDDPVLARVRELAMSFPDAQEKVSHGRPVFHTSKIFTWYGGSLKVDGEWVQHPRAVIVLPSDEERLALVERPDTFVPAYLGPRGWVGVDLDGADWDEVAELVEDSYRATAGPRRVARLDASR